MRLGAVIPVLNEWRFMRAVTGQLLKVVDRCVLVRASASQSGAPVSFSAIPDLDSRIEIIEGNWKSESRTRNAGMEHLWDCDYVFMVDSDEILLDQDLQSLKSLCDQGEHSVIAVRLHTYWKTPEFRIEPPEEGSIKMVLRKGIRMVGVREVNDPVYTSEVWCHHLSYVRTDDEVREKMRLSGHSHEFLPNWYERVWKAWDQDPALENLHPVHPAAYRRAVRSPDAELTSVLTEWGCL